MDPWAGSRQHDYRRASRIRSPLAQDLCLGLALVAVLFVHPEGALALALAAAIPAAIAWRLLTLHVPSRVEVDGQGITFSAYRRTHRFNWRDIERIHIRRFIVRDRVLVRITPAGPWRGRYWLMDTMDGYDVLLRQLEERGRQERIMRN
ncbi:MAG TPA: hypothetical protein VK550_26650 [Polyangiaceae bacterium]|nr:hypothetical protein [Polyangiaceae bacterium]